MKVIELTGEQAFSKTEVRPRTLQVQELQSGEVVTSTVNITHTPPSGDPITIAKTVSSPYIYLLLGPFAVPGTHYVKVQAVGNAPNPSKPEALYVIEVKDL